VTAVRSSIASAVARMLALVARLSGRRAGVALVYHGLAERSGNPERELVPPHGLVLFEAHLRYLRASYRLVPVEELLAAASARRRGQRFPVALTFDDDLVTHVQLAAPALQRAGVPATFFLCGASLNRPHFFWWQLLQCAIDEGLQPPIDGENIHEIADRIESSTAESREQLLAWLASHLTFAPEETGLRSEQVRELVARGFGVGFHTRRHHRLTSLDAGALAHALMEGRAELEQAATRPLTAIAYPHGKADARVADAARKAGFRFGFTGVPEPVLPECDPMLLGRVAPTHGSVAGLALQLARTLLRRRHR
jgi:peptidoglycan/xylan/chitin deacetylase (PgdA/CDA1 family)